MGRGGQIRDLCRRGDYVGRRIENVALARDGLIRPRSAVSKAKNEGTVNVGPGHSYGYLFTVSDFSVKTCDRSTRSPVQEAFQSGEQVVRPSEDCTKRRVLGADGQIR